MKRCSLREELDPIATLLSNDAHERGVSLVLHYDGPKAQALVKGDGEKLRQAFLNIIINALQATPRRGAVTITTRQSDSCHEILFNDNGPGIAAEALPRIFEPFFTTKTDGTGLGLAITKKIIEGHGGSLDIESLVGQGTSVVVRLPKLTEGAA